MSRAGTAQAVTTTPTEIFNAASDGNGVAAIAVGCNSTSTGAGILVNVTSKANPSTAEFVPIYPGGSLEFRRATGILTVNVKTISGTAAIDYGVTEDR